MSYRDDYREQGFIMSLLTSWWFLAIGLVIGGSFMFAMVKPTLLGLEREAFTQSVQRVSAAQSNISQMISSYEQLEVDIASANGATEVNEQLVSSLESQRVGLLRRIHTEVKQVPDGSLETYVYEFVESHPAN